MTFLSVSAVFKGELPYLPEWLAYHQTVGVEHFYLACNDPDPGPALAYLRKLPCVTCMPFPDCPKFHDIASHTLWQQALGKTEWLAHIDLDEFLLPVNAATVPEALQAIAKPDTGGVCVNWRVFGSSFRLKAPYRQTTGYRWRMPDGRDQMTRTYKSIVRPEAVARTIGSHHCAYKPGWKTITTAGEPAKFGRKPCRLDNPAYANLVVNHYTLRSKEEYKARVARGWAQSGGRRRSEADRWKLWDRINRLCTVFDDTINERFTAAMGNRWLRRVDEYCERINELESMLARRLSERPARPKMVWRKRRRTR